MTSLRRLGLCAGLLALLNGCALTGGPQDPEESVCGAIREPLVFALWNHVAGEPEPQRAERIPNAEAVSFTTRDGRTLRGYRLASTLPGQAPLGRLLVAQGNAMLSDRILASLTSFSQAGLDVYVFDYRGYGNSDGRRRLKAMVGDYRELAESLLVPEQGKRLLYGISFGGIVMLNAIGRGTSFDRAAIDSTPSRISHRGCAQEYDPAEQLPADARKLLLVAGAQDSVVPLQESAELVLRGQLAGAETEVRRDFAHAFMDASAATHVQRLHRIRSFLMQ